MCPKPLAIFAILVAGAPAITALSTSGCGAPEAVDSPDQGVSVDAAVPDLALSVEQDPPCDDGGLPDAGTCLRHVEAAIVDEAGAPVPQLLVSVCDDQCFFGTSGSDGRVVVPIGIRLHPELYNIVLHGRPNYAGYYAPLPPLDGEVARFKSPLVLPVLQADGPTLNTDGGAQTLTSGDVTVAIPDDAVVQPNIEDVIDSTTPIKFRARLIPNTITPAFLSQLAASDRPDRLYAVTPYEAILDGSGATLSFSNTLGLNAGDAVTVLGLGSLLDLTGPRAGTFVPIGTAHVSADGRTLSVDGPIHFFTWFGLRKKGP